MQEVTNTEVSEFYLRNLGMDSGLLNVSMSDIII
jgi:hypothetical protein